MPDTVNEELEDDFEEESLEQDEGSSDEESETSDEGEEGSPKKKDSNWKKLVKKNRELERELAELKKEGVKKEAAVPKSIDKADWLEFALENPEAKELKGDIFSLMEKYEGMSMNEAFSFAKSQKPKVSKSKTDFDFSVKSGKKKDLSSLTEEEALALPPKEFLAYERMRGTKI